jgi:hypothetical protein
MPKERKRRLWLNVRAENISVTRQEFIRALLESIKAGDYKLPRGWKVYIEWRNTKTGRMKIGPWREELEESAESSDGFDKAVTDWLRRKLR